MLIETIKLVKDFESKNYNISLVGKFNWWTVYFASKIPITKTIEQKIKSVTEDAYHKLSSLGFKKQNVNLIINQGEKITNFITGQEQDAGYANIDQHGISINLNIFTTETLIHEHAHMVWYNLPKVSKEIFINYYNNNIVDNNKKTYIKNTNLSLSGDIKESIKKRFFDKKNYISSNLSEKLVSNWFDEKYKLNPITYFKVKNAIEKKDNQEILKRILLQGHGQTCDVLLKKPIYVGKGFSNYKDTKLPINTKVKLEYVSEKYIINWYKSEYERYESNVISEEEINNYVNFEESTLTDKNQEELKEIIQLSKKSFAAIFGNDNFKYFLENHLNDDLNEAINSSSFKLYNDPKVRCLVNPIDVFNSYRAKLRFRNDKIKSEKNIYETLSEVIESKFFILDFANEEERDKYSKKNAEKHISNIGNKEGSEFRSFLHKSLNLPSEYSAANVDELWSETVAKAAMNLNSINKELKNILIKVLTMY